MKRHVFIVTAVLVFFMALSLLGCGCGAIRSGISFIRDSVKTDKENNDKVGDDGKNAGENNCDVGADERTGGESDDEVDDGKIAGENESKVDDDGEDAGENSVKSGSDDVCSSTTRQVALTFDDGPHAIYTPILLDGLKERGVKATFFLMGQNIEGNEEIVKRMSDEGHLIGNHTYSHVQLTAVSEEEALAEVGKDTGLIESITGVTVAYIRPPYGSVTQSLAEKLNLRIVLWDIDPRDWESQNASLVVKHILSHIEDGEIVLLHDIFRSSVEAALTVIDELTAQGYEFVRVDELGMYE